VAEVIKVATQRAEATRAAITGAEAIKVVTTTMGAVWEW
jgi:hypothetical protein